MTEKKMKAKYLLQTVVFFSVLFVLAVARGAERDYWPTNDWRSSSPEQQGMDSKVLEKLNSFVKERGRNVSSVLVVRHGHIVLEEYNVVGRENLRTLMSATKSVTSALIGIALKEGYLQSVDQKMIDFFPEYVSEDLNPEVKKITIRHLLTMSAGFRMDEAGIMNPTIIKNLLTKPLISEPGKDFAYNTTNANILSMIITKVTALKALDFGKKYLFSPLGISKLQWFDLFGYTTGGKDLQLTPRDMAKIGYLYLNNGKWDNLQILTPEWIEESTRMQIKVPESEKEANEDYGFLWWVLSAGSHHSYTAFGHGGQCIFVIPDLDIVTVITASAISFSQCLSVIDNFVVPSVINQ